MTPILTRHALGALVCLVGIVAAGGKRAAIDPAHAAPVDAGATASEAERCIGSRLAPDREHGAGEYPYAETDEELPGAAFMVLDGPSGGGVASFRPCEGEAVGLTEE